jgi:hypothetical protein
MRFKMGATDLVELGRSKCAAGKVWRVAHDRRVNGKTVHVEGGCIVDRGAPGKTPAGKQWAKGIPGLKKKGGFIPGWSHDSSASDRRAALRRDASRESCTTTGRKLGVVRNLNHRTNPQVARVAVTDRKWLQSQGWCLMRGGK